MAVLQMGIGERIAKLRMNSAPRLTQEGLAKKIGISRAALSHYEKDRREPDYETLEKIADFYEVTVDFLLGREVKSKTDQEAFELWANDPRIDKLYKELNESSEERKEFLLAVWETLKTQKKE